MSSYEDFIWKRCQILLGILIAVVIVLVAVDAWGQSDHKCQGNSCNNNAMGPAASNAKMLAVAGADMEINDCLATHSVAFGAWQGTHTNPHCVAARLDADGKHQEAAEMRCSIRKYRKVYGRGQACIDAIIHKAPNPPQGLNRSDDRYAQQEEEIVSLRVELAAVVELVERTQASSNAPPPDPKLAALERYVAEQEEKEAKSRAYFRSKYEAAIAKESPQ